MSTSPSSHIAGGAGGLVHLLPAKGIPMLDITTQAVATTAFIHFKGLDGNLLFNDGKPVGVRLFSPGTDEYAEVEERGQERLRKNMADNDDKYVQPSREQREADLADDLASVTAEFVNFTYPPAEGKFGKDLYRAFYLDRKLGHLKTQANKALGDWGKFAPVPSED